MAGTQQLCLLHSCPGASGTRNPTAASSHVAAVGKGICPQKKFCMKVQKMVLGEQLGKFFRTNIMHIKQDCIPLSGSAA